MAISISGSPSAVILYVRNCGNERRRPLIVFATARASVERAFFERQIDVDDVVPAEEEVAHRTADEERPQLLFGRDFLHEIEGALLCVGEVFETDHWRMDS